MIKLRCRVGLGKAGLLITLLLAGALGGLLPAVRAGADFAPAEWPYFKAITVPAGLAAGDLAAVTLDRAVLTGAAANPYDLRDLRVVRDGGREVPYQLRVAAGREERVVVPVAGQAAAAVQDAAGRGGRYVSFVADLGEGAARHNEVEILTDAVNFSRATRVETSDDAQTWAVVQEGTEIFDFSAPEGNFTSRNTRISYPESAARYVRARVRDEGGEGLKISGLAVSLATVSPPQERAYPPAAVSRVEEDGGRATVITLDLGAAGIPTSRLSFETDAPNFHRDAEIEGSDDGDRWEWLGGAAVYSYNTPRFSGSSQEVTYPESHYRYYRWTVRNGDDTPLSLADVRLYGVNRQAVFAAELGVEYALYYGNDYAQVPVYDLAQLAQYLETDDLPAATLGPQQDNPAYTGAEAPLTERYPWLPTAAVAGAALVLAALLYGVVRQARGKLRPPDAAAGSSQ